MPAAVRQRPSSGELVMSWEAFRAADYGQLCQYLGLRPSQPDRDAQGKRRRPKGKRS